MKVIKKQSKQTFISKKTGKECHYYNYFIQTENGKRIQIKVAFDKDLSALETICEFEKCVSKDTVSK